MDAMKSGGCQPARLRACFGTLFPYYTSSELPHSLPIPYPFPAPFHAFLPSAISVFHRDSRFEIGSRLDLPESSANPGPNGTRCVDASTRCGDASALNDWRSRSYTLTGFVYFVYFLIFLAFKRSNMKLPVSAGFFSNLTATATAAPQ